MPAHQPVGRCTSTIGGLGRLDGLLYANGVRQFCGIPYASLEKRWNRSKLKTWWTGDYHDGTQLGSSCPHPLSEGDNVDELVPVPPFEHFNTPRVDEKSALVMNIVVPPVSHLSKCPIFVYVHGGSLLYGGANLPIFDCVTLVSQSVEMDRPIVAINFNYRVGLGGFLAGSAIRDELERDGSHGCGNFGFTDQTVAFEWVQRYGGEFQGDISNVTACGESAGGISISNQLLAKHPAKFHRAICMSGLAFAIPAWTMEQHEELFKATCQYFHLDPKDPDILTQLRAIPEQELANATPGIQGVASGTGNPCIDGCFYDQDPLDFHEAPPWLESYMIGDVFHEGVIFHLNIAEDDFDFWRLTLLEHMGDESCVMEIFALYGIQPDMPQATLVSRMEHMVGDAIFKIPNIVTSRKCKAMYEQGKLFLYHFDQRSRLQNSLEGTAYHAHELLYLFQNLSEKMNNKELQMASDFAKAWIDFAYGLAPWEQGNGREWRWMIWGDDSEQALLTENEDDHVRAYGRIERVLNLGEPGETWRKWHKGLDVIVNKRMRLGRVTRLV